MANTYISNVFFNVGCHFVVSLFSRYLTVLSLKDDKEKVSQVNVCSVTQRRMCEFAGQDDTTTYSSPVSRRQTRKQRMNAQQEPIEIMSSEDENEVDDPNISTVSTLIHCLFLNPVVCSLLMRCLTLWSP
jgi:hypothetical protein